MALYNTAKSKTCGDIVVAFNTTLRKLTNDLVSQFPNDAVVHRIKKRVHLAISEAPVDVIEEVGQVLYGYQEQIYDSNTAFFLDSDYKKDLSESVNQEKMGMAEYILPKVKEAWKKSQSSTKKFYMSSVQSLLDDYVDYLCLRYPNK